MSQLRTLAAWEFPLLAGIDDGFAPNPSHSLAIVAEDKGQIVGRIFLVTPAHIEGPWVAPERRGSTLGGRLMKQAEVEARERGITRLLAYGANQKLEKYLAGLGYEQLPLTVWKKDL